MLFRKWRLVVFAISFLSVLSHHGAAGPIYRRTLILFSCFPRPSFASPNLFSPSVPFPPSPTNGFHLDGVDLTHIIAPPEFRAHYPEAASATVSVMQNPYWLWPPPLTEPCWPAPWEPSTM